MQTEDSFPRKVHKGSTHKGLQIQGVHMLLKYTVDL